MDNCIRSVKKKSKYKTNNPARRLVYLLSRIARFLHLLPKKKYYGKVTLRYSFRNTWQIAEVKIVANAFFTAEEQGLVQGHEIFHTDNTLIDLHCVNAYVKFLLAVCTCFFIFHSYMRKTALKVIELIYLTNS